MDSVWRLDPKVGHEKRGDLYDVTLFFVLKTKEFIWFYITLHGFLMVLNAHKWLSGLQDGLGLGAGQVGGPAQEHDQGAP